MENIIMGMSLALSPSNLLFALLGTLLGIAFGAMPGLSATMGIAVLIPVSYGMPPATGLILLAGVYVGASYGGSISAILVNTPGTPSAAATGWDGHPMALKGHATEALIESAVASFWGTVVGFIGLLTIAPSLASFSLKFSSQENVCLAIFGLTIIATLSKKNIIKGLIGGVVGLLLGCIGMDPQTGSARFTFGNMYLQDGISLVPMLIGLFGITSIMELFESFHGNEIIAALKEQKNKITKVELPNWKESRELLPTWAQSTVIGNIIGIIPGAGMIMAIFMAYNQAVTSNPDKKFGTGVPQGIAAPECANNSVVGSSMVPLLSLGIPGNSSSALFLSALTIQGLRTGPALFNNTPDVAYMIVLGFLLSNIIMLPLAIGYTSLFATAVLRMKREILSGIVIVLCVTGAFAVKNNIFNIYVIIAFGLIGYFFNKFHIPQSPLILASILGKMMESNWIQSMVFSHNNLAVFVTRPLSCALLVISLAFIVIPMIKSAKDKKKGVAKA